MNNVVDPRPKAWDGQFSKSRHPAMLAQQKLRNMSPAELVERAADEVKDRNLAIVLRELATRMKG